jgi:AraC-like DNA-binding protein
MNPRDYLTAYIAQHGGIAATAQRLGMPYSTFAAINNGTRGISPKTARKMAAADPLLDANRLVWIRPLRRGKQPARFDQVSAHT